MRVRFIRPGNMATAIGTRAAKHGHTIEVMSRDTAKAQALADQIGNGATAGTFGATPLGDIVIVAVPYANAVSVVANYGDALAGKVIIDISNTFNADATGLRERLHEYAKRTSAFCIGLSDQGRRT